MKESKSLGKRREQILEAAAPLFGGRDLSVVTMDEIAARSGVAKGTLYNYFSSKEDLYASIITARMGHLLEALEQVFRDEEDVRLRLRKLVVHTLMFLVKYPEFFRIMRREEARPEPSEPHRLRSRLQELLCGALRQGSEEGCIRSVSPELATDLILGAIEGAASSLLARGQRPARAVPETELLFDCLWSGLRASSADRGRARVLVTREEEPGQGLGRELESLGLSPVPLPLLRNAPPADPAALRRAAAMACEHDWIVFTSARAVTAFAEALARPDLPPATRLAAVGQATARRLRETLGRVDLISKHKTGADLARELEAAGPLTGLSFLLPRAAEARPELPRLLRAAGARVEEVIAYRTLAAEAHVRPLRESLERGELDAVTFASPSAVLAFDRGVGSDLLRGPDGHPLVVSIGPTTSQALRALGVEPDEEASTPELVELARAVVRALGRAPRSTTPREKPERPEPSPASADPGGVSP